MKGNSAKNTATLFDIVLVLVDRKWFIIRVFVILVVLLGVFIFVTKIMPSDWSINIFPDYFEPKAYINIQEGIGSIAKSSSSQGNILSMLMKGSGTTQNPNLELAQVILEGNLIKDKIIDEFGFIEKYGHSPSPYIARETARIEYTRRLFLIPSKNISSTIFYLLYHDVDSDLATKVLNRTLELLESRFKELTIGVVLQRKKYIENSLGATESELRLVEDKLINFSLKHGVIDLTSQAKEQSALIADLSADVIKKELEMKTLRDYMPENSPKIVLLKNEIDSRKQLIARLKKGLGGEISGVIPQDQIPSLTAEYLNLKGELDVQMKVYATLREQYELVKIEENNTTQTFQIIEAPEFLKVKTGPLRGKIVIIGIPICLLVAIAIAFFLAYFDSLKKNPIEAEKLENIKKGMMKLKNK